MIKIIEKTNEELYLKQNRFYFFQYYSNLARGTFFNFYYDVDSFGKIPTEILAKVMTVKAFTQSKFSLCTSDKYEFKFYGSPNESCKGSLLLWEQKGRACSHAIFVDLAKLKIESTGLIEEEKPLEDFKRGEYILPESLTQAALLSQDYRKSAHEVLSNASYEEEVFYYYPSKEIKPQIRCGLGTVFDYEEVYFFSLSAKEAPVREGRQILWKHNNPLVFTKESIIGTYAVGRTRYRQISFSTDVDTLEFVELNKSDFSKEYVKEILAEEINSFFSDVKLKTFIPSEEGV